MPEMITDHQKMPNLETSDTPDTPNHEFSNPPRPEYATALHTLRLLFNEQGREALLAAANRPSAINSLGEFWERRKTYKDREKEAPSEAILPGERPEERLERWFQGLALKLDNSSEQKQLTQIFEFLENLYRDYPRFIKGVVALGCLTVLADIAVEGIKSIAKQTSPFDEITAPVPPLPSLIVTPDTVMAFAEINARQKENPTRFTPVDSEDISTVAQTITLRLGTAWDSWQVQDSLWNDAEARLGPRTDPSLNLDREQALISGLLDQAAFANELHLYTSENPDIPEHLISRDKKTYQIPIKLDRRYNNYELLSLRAPVPEILKLFAASSLTKEQIDYWRLNALLLAQSETLQKLGRLPAHLTVTKEGEEFVLTAPDFQPYQKATYQKARDRIIEAINRRIIDDSSYDKRSVYDVDFDTFDTLHAERMATFILAHHRLPTSVEELPPYTDTHNESGRKNPLPISPELNELLGLDSALTGSDPLTGQALEKAILKMDNLIKKAATLMARAHELELAKLGALIAESHNAYHCAKSKNPGLYSETEDKFFERYHPNRHIQGKDSSHDLKFSPIYSFTVRKTDSGELEVIDTEHYPLIERGLRRIRAMTCF
ncbi:MAG: hypothetical protein UT55_C0010G0009 [Candidatus Peregrinibacteria bacterium GW2011_GWE2_39_6]|nr:MAG: hypothetical protein UT36_C0006G0010 [Candidatus Peregrinibacteria bacterium GW2011_GWF2_39_17]KKR26346.1 MAG: hypothetical protein UT55_C0010G0009 [Candidatus Peregrinibacteria bacterium GW2011_GWE2_39_6]HCW32825.1 hypothetical protein [Candidatus Peregrinibacteria bacterium]